MKIGDWIVLSSKRTSTIHIGEYTYDINNGNPYYHYRNIDWFVKDIPRNNFEQVKTNNWKVPGAINVLFSNSDDSQTDTSINSERGYSGCYCKTYLS